MLDKIINLKYTYKLTAVSMLLFFVNPWLALLVGFVVACLEWKNQPAADIPGWALWLPGAAMLGLWAAMSPMPVDDLNRHVTAWRVNFDYRAQYPLAELPKENMWLGFDWLMYQLQLTLSITPVQLAKWWPLTMAAMAYGLFVLNCRKLAGTQANSLLLLAITVCFFPVATRAWMGRPEFLYVLLLAAAFHANTPLRKVAWTTGFCLLIPTYWMGWSYAASVLLFDRQDGAWRQRVRNVAIGAVLAMAHIAFWQWYTGDYWAILDWLKRTLQHVVPTESYSLDQTLMATPGLALFLWLGVQVARFEKADFVKHAPVLLLLAWLSFSNQVRFLAPIMMVAVPWLLSVTPAQRLTGQVKLIMVCISLSLMVQGQGAMATKQPRFKVPANAFVVSTDPYAAVLYSSAGVRVEPSPAIGATPKELADGLSEGRFDCAKALAKGVTHLIEKALPSKPACATLLEVQDEWRYWRIK